MAYGDWKSYSYHLDDLDANLHVNKYLARWSVLQQSAKNRIYTSDGLLWLRSDRPEKEDKTKKNVIKIQIIYTPKTEEGTEM